MNQSPQPDEQILKPADIAQSLGISTATLRRWSRRFEGTLQFADGQEQRSHRRYTTTDLETLELIKTLLDQGLTYDEVQRQLHQDRGEPRQSPSPGLARADQSMEVGSRSAEDQDYQDETADEAAAENERMLVPRSSRAAAEAEQNADGTAPALRFLRDAFDAVSDNQQIILNSQQANRDLLGVMIQDNLNLKGENTSLRERMLDLERELAELRRRQADYRERMETRVRVLEDAVATLMANKHGPSAPTSPRQSPGSPAGEPESAGAPTERRSFWSRLIGG